MRPTVSARPIIFLGLGLAISSCLVLIGCQSEVEENPNVTALKERKEIGLAHFVSLMSQDFEQSTVAMDMIEADWQPSFAGMMIECLRHMNFSAKIKADRVLKSKTGYDPLANASETDQFGSAGPSSGVAHNAWLRWLWSQPYQPHPDYPKLKAEIYSYYDPSFAEYFEDAGNAEIRLDEVQWGGVKRDGIPPLDQPEMIAADAARYLDDSDVVFGIKINGDTRAYPKRILAWHEMFKDKIGGIAVCGVY